jgi:autotransporter-associated beta strand protein
MNPTFRILPLACALAVSLSPLARAQFTYSGGTATMTSGSDSLGALLNSSYSVWNQFGGAVTSSGTSIGYYDGLTHSQSYTISGGTFNASGEVVLGDVSNLGGGSTGTFNQTGGTVTMSGGVRIRSYGSSYNLTGGTLYTAAVVFGGRSESYGRFYLGTGGTLVTSEIHRNLQSNAYRGDFVFDGGTLQANPAAASPGFGWINSEQYVYISDHGGRIDTAGTDRDIYAPLQHDSGGASLDGGLTKLGTGALSLWSANTYTGNTTISAGKLFVNNTNGSGFGTGNVSVANGATVGGSGSFTGILTLAGKVSPGSNSAAGALVTGSETWNTGSSYQWEISDASGSAGSGYDFLSINGALTVNTNSTNRFTIYVTSLNGSSPGNAANFDSSVDQHWIIATTASAWSFNASQFTVDTSGFTNSVGPNSSWSVTQVGNSLQLNFTAIPEPKQVAIAVSFLLGAIVLLHRRQRSR